MLQAGDLLLTAKRDSLTSKLIRAKVNSEYSHVIPIVGPDTGLNTTFPVGARIESVERYLGGAYDVLRLRPSFKLNDSDRRAWLSCAGQLVGKKYDLKSYLGFITNKNLQASNRLNCAETGLIMCQTLGLLTARDLRLVSPQSFVEFVGAGVFEVVKLP